MAQVLRLKVLRQEIQDICIRRKNNQKCWQNNAILNVKLVEFRDLKSNLNCYKCFQIIFKLNIVGKVVGSKLTWMWVSVTVRLLMKLTRSMLTVTSDLIVPEDANTPAETQTLNYNKETVILANTGNVQLLSSDQPQTLCFCQNYSRKSFPDSSSHDLSSCSCCGIGINCVHFDCNRSGYVDVTH